MVLNGGMFFASLRDRKANTRFQNIPRGEVCPNIFWYDGREDPINIWHGLAGLRVLQLAKLYSNLTAGQLLTLTSECFGYYAPVLREIFDAYVAFGLIAIDEDKTGGDAEKTQTSAQPLVDTKEDFAPYQDRFSISKKGALMLDINQRHVGLLYFFCLDSTVHDSYNINAFIRFNRDPYDWNNYYFNFHDAQVITTATFLKHIYHYDRAEREALSKKTTYLEKRYRRLRLSVTHLEKMIAYPKATLHTVYRRQVTHFLSSRFAPPPTLTNDTKAQWEAEIGQLALDIENLQPNGDSPHDHDD